MKSRNLFMVFLTGLILAAPLSATAQEAAPAPAPEAATAKPLGVALDGGLASAYLFRGLNVFGDKQSDPHGVFSPTVAWTHAGSGLSLTYWGAFQLNGENLGAKTDVGAGFEQDFILGWSRAFLDNKLNLKAALTAYVFPFADKELAGARVPLYLEPSVTPVYTTFADFSLQIAYFHAVQGGLSDYRYLYVRPYVSKSFKLSDKITQTVGAGYGYKLFNDRDKMTENVQDLAFDLETTIAVTPSIYVKPALRGGWTNLTGKSFGDEVVFLFSVNVGTSF